MSSLGRTALETTSFPTRLPPVAVPRATTASSFFHRALDALAKTVLGFAAAHVLLLFADAVIRRDLASFNLFTMLEAQRLWPALASATAQPWSLVFAALVFAVVFATLARHARSAGAGTSGRVESNPAPSIPLGPSRAPVTGTNGHAGPGAPRVRPALRAFYARPTRLSAGAGLLALVVGLTVHMMSLAVVDFLVREFPPVPDLVHEQLPYVEFGPPGEIAYGVFLVLMTLVLLRTQRRTMPVILLLLGVFYAVRGLFLFLLPIGIPPDAPPLGERFVLWPYAGHAYFPGGHTGMMTVLSLSVASRPWRRAFLAMTFAFAIGTLLARTHYAADAFGGWLVGYAVVLWGRGRFGVLAGGAGTRREARRGVVTPLENEA